MSIIFIISDASRFVFFIYACSIKNNVYKYIDDSESNMRKDRLGTWELAIIIAGPIGVVCLVVMLIMNFWAGSTKRHGIRYLPTPRNIAADQQPILTAAVSLRDMIEMTTSGSGSGF